MSKNLAIVLGLFHKQNVETMLQEAHRIASSEKLNIVKEIWVPGSLEKPLAVKHVLESKDVDAAVVLGIIERGETKHGLVMGMAVISSLIDLQLKYNKPVGIGIIGPEVLPHQIEPRLIPHARAAVLAAKKMLEVLNQ